MMKNRSFLYKAIPWLIIAFGFLSLNIIPPMFGWLCILLGVVILIERKWPENWNLDNENSNTAEKQQL